MKIMKKIAAAALASAALFAFVGCAETEDPYNMLSVSGKKCTIDHVNESPAGSKTFNRGFKTLKIDHFDAVCKIETTVNTTSDNGDGVMGYVFDVLENKDGTYNFSIIGVRYNVSKRKPEAYISRFTNVAGGDKLSAGNNFCDIDGKEIVDGKPEASKAKETKILPTSGVYKELMTSALPLPADKKVSIWIDLVYQDGESTNRTGTKGSYKVSFYREDPKRSTKASGKDTTYNVENLDDIRLISTVDIPVAETNSNAIENGQTKLGFYANVYDGKTLTGTWELLDLEGAAEPVELD